MLMVDRDFAQFLLSDPNLGAFWEELGGPLALPAHFHYLYEPDVGLFVVEPVEDYYGIHVAIFPECRGKIALRAGKEAIQWVLARSGKALARVRKNQPETRFYAALCGMKRYSEDEAHVYFEVVKCH